MEKHDTLVAEYMYKLVYAPNHLLTETPRAAGGEANTIFFYKGKDEPVKTLSHPISSLT
jgi:hypothetical protein